MNIGVFDSGIGGLSVAKAIEAHFPDHTVEFVNDSKNVPYGTKPVEQLRELVTPIFLDLASRNEVIVVACNTITTTLIEELRKVVPVPLVGIEPMVKPAAALTKTGVIAICATPTTLGSQRYAWLKKTYASNCTVLEPDCSDWSYMIEHNEIDRDKIKRIVVDAVNHRVDVIVLGCTHYHWIEDLIVELADGKAKVLQPEQAIIRQLERVIAEL